MRILLFGKIPPPIGGVTVSVRNLIDSLKRKKIEVDLFSIKSVFRRYSIGHVHYSKPYKRFLGILLARIKCKKVIFTLHGSILSLKNIFNKLSILLAHGVILLNHKTYKQYSFCVANPKLLTPIFEEGVENKNQLDKYLSRESSYKYILLYSYSDQNAVQKDIYGVNFILSNYHKLDPKYVLVILDPLSTYKNVVSLISRKNIYIDRFVNFVSLLSEVDIYIRPTKQDGNSVAVLEALQISKAVLASDCVDRPEGVTTFKSLNFDDFNQKLNSLKYFSIPHTCKVNKISDYISYCEELLNQ